MIQNSSIRSVSIRQLCRWVTLLYLVLGGLLILVADIHHLEWGMAMAEGEVLLLLRPWLYLVITAVGVYLLTRHIAQGLFVGNYLLDSVRHREHRLTHQLARLQLTTDSIMQGSSQGIFGLDTEGRVTFINPAMCEMLGYQEHELVGYMHHDVVHHHYPDGRPYPPDECPVYRALHSGEHERGEEHYVRKDGSFLPVEFTCSPLWERGTRIGAVVFFLDISERKQSEHALELASRVFANALEGLMITDDRGDMISVNPAFTRITGYRPEEVLGRNPRILKSGQHDRAFYEQMWQALEVNGQWSGEIWNRRKDGEIAPEWLNISVVRDVNGKVTNYIGSFTDTSALKASQEQLHYMAHHDPLTGLPNRLVLNDRLEQAIAVAHRESRLIAVLFLDLNDFKHINDSLGHPTGDEMLRQVAKRLEQVLRKGDTVARLGGDEFIILLDRLESNDDAAVVARKLETLFKDPFQVDGRELYAGVSIGISLYPGDGEDAHTLIRNADASMYRAKELGSENYHFYTKELTRISSDRILIEGYLRHALERDEMSLAYQPQYELYQGDIVAVEALLRWQNPQLGTVAPTEFIRIAEQTGLILQLGEWVLRKACNEMAAWRAAGMAPDRIAVNLSGVQVRRDSVVGLVRSILDESGLPASCLELEITESFIMDQTEHSIDILQQLKVLGVWISIDDFGTGYSSLSYLKRLPVDRLKIDRTFIKGIPEDINNLAIVKAIVALGQNLQLKVLAEGVETEDQCAFLTTIGCSEAQGYLFSRPVPREQLLRIVRKNRGHSDESR